MCDNYDCHICGRDTVHDPGTGHDPICQCATELKSLRARVAELEEGMESLLRARPSALECHDFHHAPKDRHEGFNCPCKARWDTAVEAACNLLNR